MMRPNWDTFTKCLEPYRDDARIPRLYEFGESLTVMPVAAESGSYFSFSICLLYILGTGPLGDVKLPSENLQIAEYPNGWKFICVRIDYTDSPNALTEKLKEADKRLSMLRASNG